MEYSNYTVRKRQRDVENNEANTKFVTKFKVAIQGKCISSLKRGVVECFECSPLIILRKNTPESSHRAKGPIVYVNNPKIICVQ